MEFGNRFLETDYVALADAIDDTGLEPVGVHVDLSVIEAAVKGKNDLIGRCDTVGVDHLVVPHPPSQYFQTPACTESLAARYTELAANLRTHNINLVHHTSRKEFYPQLTDSAVEMLSKSPIPDGVTWYVSRMLSRIPWANSPPEFTGFRTLVDNTDSKNLQFEIDVAEVTAGRVDPVGVSSLVADRLPMLHLRNVTQTGRLGSYRSARPGPGEVDYERIIDFATESGIEWVVYENELQQDPESKLTEGAALLAGLSKQKPDEDIAVEV